MAVLARSIPLNVLSILLIGAATAGCRFGAEQWGPFRGRMVDADTGAPIAGGHFMVSWERHYPNPIHWTQSFYDAQEAVTEADGRFEIPRRRRFFTFLVSEPRFSAFAPAYFAQREEVVSPGGRLYVDDTVLRMQHLSTRAEQCEREPSGIGGRFPKDEVPRFSAAIDDYISRLGCGR